MPITVVCHKCGNFATVPDSAAGKQCNCPQCGNAVSVPGGRRCSDCRADISRAEPLRDATGNYFCPGCWEKRSHVDAPTSQNVKSPTVAPNPPVPANDNLRCAICYQDRSIQDSVNFAGRLVCKPCAAAKNLGTISYQLKMARRTKRVLYACPYCQAELESAMQEAGNQDSCPQCGVAFAVPGRYEAYKAQQEMHAAQLAASRNTNTQGASTSTHKRYLCMLLDGVVIALRSLLLTIPLAAEKIRVAQVRGTNWGAVCGISLLAFGLLAAVYVFFHQWQSAACKVNYTVMESIAIAAEQKALIWLYGIGALLLVLFALVVITVEAVTPSPTAWIWIWAFLGIVAPVYGLISAIGYQLAKTLRLNAWLWCAVMALPVVSIATVLVLNDKATVALRSRGIAVGLTGAKARDLAKFRSAEPNTVG